MAKPLCCPCDLGPKPKIENAVQAERAVEALAWCNAKADKAEAALKLKVAAATTASAKSLTLQVDDVETTVDAYAALLEAELRRWALENRESLFTAKKSVDYSHGGIALKAGSTSITSIGEMANLEERVWKDVADELNAVLEAKGYLGFWRVKIEPDLQGMGKALKDNTKSPSDLQKQGFRQVQGETKVTVSTK